MRKDQWAFCLGKTLGWIFSFSRWFLARFFVSCTWRSRYCHSRKRNIKGVWIKLQSIFYWIILQREIFLNFTNLHHEISFKDSRGLCLEERSRSTGLILVIYVIYARPNAVEVLKLKISNIFFCIHVFIKFSNKKGLKKKLPSRVNSKYSLSNQQFSRKTIKPYNSAKSAKNSFQHNRIISVSFLRY